MTITLIFGNFRVLGQLRETLNRLGQEGTLRIATRHNLKHLHKGIAPGNRPMYQHDYAQKRVSAMPDVEIKLRQGGRVAEVVLGRCGYSVTDQELRISANSGTPAVSGSPRSVGTQKKPGG